MSVSISVERLTYVYHPGAPTACVALRDVSLAIPQGACVGIVGVTGSGKSTLVQHFNGLLQPTSGRVVVDGMEIGAQTPPGALRRLRRRVGLLFQFPEAQLFAPSVAEDVAFGPRQLGLAAAEVEARVRWALEAVALPVDEAFLARSPFALSGGQRRRVALAGVLAMRPRTLVLDEPNAGLDAEGRDELHARLAELRAREGITLVVVSHDMSEVAALAETVFVLADGELRLAGPPREIFIQTEALGACGLLPPPLATVAALARARGFAVPDHTALDVEALAEALARGASH
jgi:energy-coupling factor transport system ATP-binding protein